MKEMEKVFVAESVDEAAVKFPPGALVEMANGLWACAWKYSPAPANEGGVVVWGEVFGKAAA